MQFPPDRPSVHRTVSLAFEEVTMFAPMLTTRMICKPGTLMLALCGLMLLSPAPAWAQAKDVKCNGCVDSGDIADGAVTSADIANGTISMVDIGAGAVDSARIADHTVTNNDIAPGVLDIHAVGDSGSIVIPAAAFQ